MSFIKFIREIILFLIKIFKEIQKLIKKKYQKFLILLIFFSENKNFIQKVYNVKIIINITKTCN